MTSTTDKDDNNTNTNTNTNTNNSSFTFNPPPPPTNALDYNGWANWYRNVLGLNVIPANTAVFKKPIVHWEIYQNTPIPDKLHQEWIDTGMFKQGIAIIAGIPFHRPDLQDAGLVYCLVDIDAHKSKIALQEFYTMLKLATMTTTTTTITNSSPITLTANDFDKLLKQIKNNNSKIDIESDEYESKLVPMEEIAQTQLIEWHSDNGTKFHTIFLTPIAFDQKSQDKIIGLEVKSLGSHGVLFCTPSIHRNDISVTGEYRYQHLGTYKPAVFTEAQAKLFQEYLHWVCKRYNVPYKTTKEQKTEDKVNEDLKHSNPDWDKHNKDFQLQNLSPHIIDTTVAYLQPFWQEHIRNDMTFCLAGMGWYAKITLESMLEIVQKIVKATADNELEDRIKAVHRTYKRGIEGDSSNEIKGAPSLKELIAQTKGSNIQIASSLVEDLKGLWSNDIIRQLIQQKNEDQETTDDTDNQQQSSFNSTNHYSRNISGGRFTKEKRPIQNASYR